MDFVVSLMMLLIICCCCNAWLEPRVTILGNGFGGVANVSADGAMPSLVVVEDVDVVIATRPQNNCKKMISLVDVPFRGRGLER